jgi:hypothetical protein
MKPTRLPPDEKIENAYSKWIPLIAISIGVGFLWYLLLYGRFPLYLSHVNWIYNAGGDVLQHQLGWEWFRQEPWRFPFGSIHAYGYPVGTSIAFMDSIPLLAIPFKLLSPWMEENFQYLGIWELGCVIAQMLTGMLILCEFTRSWVLKILGASLLVLSPPMIFRAFYHSSLSAQWILLAAIWFILLEYRGRLWRGAWFVLFGVAMWVHIYFIPMLLPLWLISLFFHYCQEPRKWLAAVDFLVVAAIILGMGYAIGIFSLEYHSLLISGFGLFSWNLNGFFNPFHYSSAYLKEMATGNSGQYEGFSYLGLGMLMLLPAAVYVFLQNEDIRRKWSFFLPFGLAALVYTLFALSNKAFFGSHPLWDVDLPTWLMDFFNLFRVSGRFIWVVFYFLVLFIILSIIRNLRYPIPVLLLVVLFQFSDLHPLYAAKKLDGFSQYETPLQSDFWQAAANTNRHIVMLPYKKLSISEEALAIYAVHNHLTLNRGYFARSDIQAMRAYGVKVWKDLQSRQAERDTVYILTGDKEISFAQEKLAKDMYVCEIDDYSVVFSAENELTHANVNLADDCLVPTP